MSLFEDDQYQYCDTYFVYFDHEQHPTAKAVVEALQKTDERCEISDVRELDGKFEALCLRSPHDASAMDITVVRGDEVREQINELMDEFRTMTLNGDDYQKLDMMKRADTRLDLFHFERVGDSVEPAFDPGGLFLVLQKLNQVCSGVGLDPQSKTLI